MQRRTLLVVALLVVPMLLMMSASPAAASGVGFAWGSDLSQWGSFIDADRNAALQVALASGMNTIGTDAKDAGPVGWASPTFTTVTKFSPGDGGVERVTRDAHANGMRVIARFDVFQDSVAASKFPGSRIGGTPPWVDPACAEVRGYALDQVRELVRLVPIDEINFDHIRYPDSYEASTSNLPCTEGSADRSAIITSWVKDAAAAARLIRPNIVVSISVFAYTMKAPMPVIGQDAARLAPHVDVLRPMLYPSYDSKAAEADPYAAVKSYTALGVKAFGAAKIQPWIQGFGSFSLRPDLVCAQFKGIVDGGATGGLVWWFPSTGTSRTFWENVASCVPAAAPAPSPGPAPTPNAFDVVFTPKKGNTWWVETKAASSQDIAGVRVSVNDGPPIALSKNPWGAWSKSFHVPDGATVLFSAVSSTGAVNTSTTRYLWPSGTPVTQGAPAAMFDAAFKRGASNEWWVEGWVTASAPLAGVTASVNGGPPVALALKSWGSWAKSFYVPKGSTVVFVATATSGATATSPPFAWP